LENAQKSQAEDSGLTSIIKVIDRDASKACVSIIVKVQWVLEIF